MNFQPLASIANLVADSILLTDISFLLIRRDVDNGSKWSRPSFPLPQLWP